MAGRTQAFQGLTAAHDILVTGIGEVGVSIARRPDGRYRARYRDESGKEHARHFARKADATRWEALQKAAVARGDWIDPERAGVTVGAVAAVWLRSKERLKPTTKQN